MPADGPGADADLSREALASALPGREARVYPAVVSTEAAAMAWSRTGAAEGSLVVAEHQFSARGRPLRPWREGPAPGASFSLILRPSIPPLRGGWLFLVGTAGIAAALGQDAAIAWPDEVHQGGGVVAHVGVHLEATVRGLEWALLNVMLVRATPPRASVVARVVDAIEARYRMPPDALVEEWQARCPVVGAGIDVTLYPIGAGRRLSGRVVGIRPNGALLVESGRGRAESIRPQDVSRIEIVSPVPRT